MVIIGAYLINNIGPKFAALTSTCSACGLLCLISCLVLLCFNIDS